MPTCRDVLNEIKWHHDALDATVVHYVHRGAPGDRASFAGDEVVELHHSFVELAREGQANTMVPYHRIMRIDRAGTTVWHRDRDHPGGEPEG